MEQMPDPTTFLARRQPALNELLAVAVAIRPTTTEDVASVA